MSDEEYEKFEINDYDLENEFNPNRNRRRPTKNQQIYGIWADDSDQDEGGPSTSRRGRRTAQDYSAPVNFVAGGIQQAGKKKEKDGTKKDGQKSDESGEDEGRPSFGGDNTSSESDGEAQEMAGFRNRPTGPAQKFPGNIANWEKHTSGIGSKLLLKMGYEPGKGLGKNLQGISTPIQAQVRKGRGAIGAYGPEVGQTLADQKKPAKKMDQDEKETAEFQEKMQQWKKEPGKGKKFRYFNYKTPEDLISEKGKRGYNYSGNEKASNKLGQVTVIDMTGPEKRVLSGYHALGQSRAATDEVIYESTKQDKMLKTKNFALPELMHNLNLIVDMCEQEIIANDQAQKSAIDKETSLKRERENLEKVVELESKHLIKLEEVESLVESLIDPKDDLTLEAAERVFLILQTDYESEFEDFGLSDLVPGIIAPLITAKLLEWQPLKDPTAHIDILKRWREILKQKDISSATLFEPYSVLIWSGVVPSIRQSASIWNPRSHQQMIALLDAWAPLFPSRIFDNILEQIILPRLVSGVEEWDPLTDTTPIHVWIHPWTGLLNEKLNEKIFPTIREKLGVALKAWMPQDRSALAMLRPWKSVFADGDLQSFLFKHILPKLQAVLSDFIINPLQQDLEPWNQVWEWNEMMSVQSMAHLLDKFFFPRWMQTLVIWLNQNPNLDQVVRWYTGWKNLLSEDIQKQTNIKEHLRRSLELMHRATGSVNIPVPDPPIISIPQISNPPPTMMDLQAPPPPTIEFKELVSQKCAERGIIFAPMPGRREQGKQVYRIGKLFCYIDRSVIMMSDGNLKNWSPVSLVSIMEKAVLGYK